MSLICYKQIKHSVKNLSQAVKMVFIQKQNTVWLKKNKQNVQTEKPSGEKKVRKSIFEFPQKYAERRSQKLCEKI